MTRTRASSLAAAVVTLWTLACAREPHIVRWEEDLYYTEKLYVDGQFQLARDRFRKLRATATTPRDADEAAVEECEAQSRAGQLREAMTCYDALAVTGAERPVRMRAVLHAAELRFDKLGMRKEGLQLFTALVQHAPDTAAGLRAVDYLTLYGQENAAQRDEILRLFTKLEAEAPDSELADNLLLRAAVLLQGLDTREADAQAVLLLERNEARHVEASTYFDTLDLHGKLLRRLGRTREEAFVLQRIIETGETSYIFASYVGPVHRDAFARLIELYRGPLLDLGKAEMYARRLPEILHHPLELPKYLMTIAEIQEQRGNLSGAIATCQRLLDEMRVRQERMAQNDRRICEEGTEAEREECLQTVQAFQPIEARDVTRARETIARLQAQLHGAVPPARRVP